MISVEFHPKSVVFHLPTDPLKHNRFVVYLKKKADQPITVFPTGDIIQPGDKATFEYKKGNWRRAKDD